MYSAWIVLTSRLVGVMPSLTLTAFIVTNPTVSKVASRGAQYRGMMAARTVKWPWKTRRPLAFAPDAQMERRASLANEFYAAILAPDEDPGFVSDEATLRDVSLAPDEDLLRKIESYYGYRMCPRDFQRSFWSMLDVLERSRQRT